MMIAANIISMTILFAVPLLLVAMGGMFSEHSGVINIALEGMMIIGALFACFTLQGLDQSGFGPAHPQLSMFIAILVAGITGMIFSLFLAFAAINLKADQTIGGTALNQFAPAFAVVMTWAIQGQGLTTIFIPNWVRITRETFGLAPVDGPSFWNNLIFKYFYLTTPVAIVLFIAAYIVLYKTRFGLRLRACGEHPQAADSVGINVYKMRYAGDFRPPGRHRRPGLHGGSRFRLQLRRRRLRFPGVGRYDFRQLETAADPGRVAVLRAVQGHCRAELHLELPAEV